MQNNLRTKIFEIQNSFLGELLSLAEIGLEPSQFRQYKKQVFKLYHERYKSEIQKVFLESIGNESWINQGNENHNFKRT